MTESKPENAHSLELLSEVSRRTRKYLLAVSALSIGMVKIGLIPSRITALGIELESANQDAIVLSMLAIVAYFSLAFCVYAWSDFVQSRIQIQEFYAENRADFLRQMDPKTRRKSNEIDRLIDDERSGVRFWNGHAYWAYIARAIFDYALPLVAAGVAAYILLDSVVCST